MGALLAAGAAPGTALTFLMIGSATNFTENLNLYKMIGPKAMLLNLVQLILYGMGLGYITNKLLMPGFKPMIDIDVSEGSISFVNSALVVFPDFIEIIASIIVIILAIKALIPKILKIYDDLSEKFEHED